MFTCSIVLLALLAAVQGRAVNISNTWVLPEEGFPVFYRYFRDRISWYEADAVCQFHHANLVTVDTTAQYDAVRAYLKELDISSAVWVGLIRSNPDGDFTWTDYRGLSGDGYWSAAPDARAAPLCAAADPAADYRWEARACGGPTVASFICELPVPQWALGNEGCMVRALPALTILYLPESAAVQLTADCGLAGVKRVQCTGNVKRENLLKDLSCNDEEEMSSTSSSVSGGSTAGSVTDVSPNSTDWETTEITTEEDTTTEHENETKLKIPQSTPIPINVQEKLSMKQKMVINKHTNVYTHKNINLDLIHNNNLQSNDIPKLANNENFLTLEQSEKLEDEKHMHHKMLHDELAKHANFETIFTQPTDHFVPPLVMAKAKISDDMTVLSLAEKHAQQLADHGFVGHNLLDDQKSYQHSDSHNSTPPQTTEEPKKLEIIDKPIVLAFQPNHPKDNIKKDKTKSSLPKKYIEKIADPKGKTLKIDGKIMKFDKTIDKPAVMVDFTTKISEGTTSMALLVSKNKSEDNSMELTVALKEPDSLKKDTAEKTHDDIGEETHEYTPENEFTTEKIAADALLKITPIVVEDTATGHKTSLQTNIDNKETISDVTTNSSEEETVRTDKTTSEDMVEATTDAMSQVSLNHEVIKITVKEDEKVNITQTVFEITTLVPELKNAVNNYNNLDHSTFSQNSHVTNSDVTTISESIIISTATDSTTEKVTITNSAAEPTTNLAAITTKTETVLSQHNEAVNKEVPKTTKVESVISGTATLNITETKDSDNHSTTATTNIPYTMMKEKSEGSNISEIYEEDVKNPSDIEAIDDLNSPLLSAANEPLHRPNRLRRPQTPQNRLNKFNPFRILG